MGKMSKKEKQYLIIGGGIVILYLLYRYYESRKTAAAGAAQTNPTDKAAGDYAALAGNEQADIAALQHELAVQQAAQQRYERALWRELLKWEKDHKHGAGGWGPGGPWPGGGHKGPWPGGHPGWPGGGHHGGWPGGGGHGFGGGDRRRDRLEERLRDLLALDRRRDRHGRRDRRLDREIARLRRELGLAGGSSGGAAPNPGRHHDHDHGRHPDKHHHHGGSGGAGLNESMDRSNDGHPRMPHTPAVHHRHIASRSNGQKPGITNFTQTRPTTFTTTHMVQHNAPAPGLLDLIPELFLGVPPEPTTAPGGHNPGRRKH